MNRWHVGADRTVTGPGGREWTGAPSHRAAIGFARNMAGLDYTLAVANAAAREATVTPIRPRRPHYGFGPASSLR